MKSWVVKVGDLYVVELRGVLGLTLMERADSSMFMTELRAHALCDFIVKAWDVPARACQMVM